MEQYPSSCSTAAWSPTCCAADHRRCTSVDELIDQITVDAYGDEGQWCFLQAFEDAIQFPIPATFAGMPVMVTGLDFDGNKQRGMVAISNETTTAPRSPSSTSRYPPVRRWLR
jgi:hypothetical protein